MGDEHRGWTLRGEEYIVFNLDLLVELINDSQLKNLVDIVF